MKRIFLILGICLSSFFLFSSCDLISDELGEQKESSDSDRDDDSGSGSGSRYTYITCAFCKGDGLCMSCGGDGYWLDNSDECPKCRHTGICKNCGGSGEVKVRL